MAETLIGTTMKSAVYDDLHDRVLPEPDVHVVTSGDRCILAHSGILASVSPVLESIIDRPMKHRSSKHRIIPILGVPDDAVSAFVRFLYSSRCTEEELETYGMHLLALSHVYLVPQLKNRCTRAVGQRLTIDNVIDVLQLTRLCDAPDLYLKCMRLVSAHFKPVENTEAWKFMQENDPWLELEILRFMDEAESRKKRSKRRRDEQRLYLELNEAMECLDHICTEGCTGVGPYDAEETKKRAPCDKFNTCQGLQHLIKHFATCKKRAKGGCLGCKRMQQLLRLHACLCEQTNSCKVPLCRQFKLKMQQERKNDDALWKLLARKVASAKALYSLSLAKRKRDEGPKGLTTNESWH